MHTTKIVFRKTPLNWKNGIVGLGSYLIRKITGSKFDHAERLINGVVYSGTQQGVRAKPLEEWRRLYKDQSDLIVEASVQINDDNFIKLFNQVKGAKYDYVSLLAHVAYRITGKWWGKKENGANRFYCTEFVAFASGMPDWYLWDVKKWENYLNIK